MDASLSLHAQQLGALASRDFSGPRRSCYIRRLPVCISGGVGKAHLLETNAKLLRDGPEPCNKNRLHVPDPSTPKSVSRANSGRSGEAAAVIERQLIPNGRY